MSDKERYRHMDKTNTSYEEFRQACYERAKLEPDPVYAKEGLDWGSEHGLELLYNEGISVESAVYLECM